MGGYYNEKDCISGGHVMVWSDNYGLVIINRNIIKCMKFTYIHVANERELFNQFTFTAVPIAALHPDIQQHIRELDRPDASFVNANFNGLYVARFFINNSRKILIFVELN